MRNYTAECAREISNFLDALTPLACEMSSLSSVYACTSCCEVPTLRVHLTSNLGVHALVVVGVHAAIIIIIVGTFALIQINNVNKRATPFTVRER
jgi:hypothetical protein